MKNISELHYEPSVGETFTTLYARNRDIYGNRMAGLPNVTRINKLFRKFCKCKHDHFLDSHLPPSPKDLTFVEKIEKCEKEFGDSTFLCYRCFKCLNLAIRKGEYFHKCPAFVNRMRSAFSFGWLKEYQFRCLVIIQGLCSPLYAEICLKLLSLLDKNPDITLHHLADDYNTFRSLIAHSKMFESYETRACHVR